MTFCCWASGSKCFKGLWFLHIQGQAFFLRLLGLNDPEYEDTTVIQYVGISHPAVQCHIPEGSSLGNITVRTLYLTSRLYTPSHIDTHFIVFIYLFILFYLFPRIVSFEKSYKIITSSRYCCTASFVHKYNIHACAVLTRL